MVKQGYKQTEVGVIPEDWAVRTLETLYNITSSKRVFQSQWRKSGIPFYRAREIAVMSDGKPAPEDLYIDESLYDLYTRQYGSIKKNDVLITGVGTLGKVYVVKENDRFYFKDGNIIWLQFKGGFSSQYLKHQYDMPVLINQVFGNAGGSTVATYTITNAKATKVPLPPLEEQDRIAEALSDVDNMISSLEKLIAKKKAVKQGAMQELLTGKKRLPGFTGEWETYKLDEIAKIIMGQSPDSKFYNDSNGMPLIQGNADISNRKTWVRFYTTQITKKAFAGDIIFTVRAPVGNVAKTSFDCCVGRGVCALRDANDFLFHYLVYIEPYWATLSAGSTFDSINSDTLANTELLIPSDVEEQTAIASILSDMDNEIEALEQKLEKTRQVKQGMMQQLLTGKIRLIDDATNASAPDDSGKILTPKTQTNHNHQFDDAVMIAAVVNSFYSPKYRLGRKKVQKLLYLLRRKQEADTSAFKKKAAGPYADEVRYKGGEPIAKHNGYIETKKNNKGTLFSIGPKMASALEYIAKWQMQDSLDWLVKTFKYIGVEELELLATVDMAMCDLVHAGIEVSVDSIKQLIRSNEEWKAKLKKVTFSDDAIARAIEKCRELFGY